ncbi:hypothetical protein F3J14_20835 [Burkholderia sp. Tr-862]|uniref:hypothetical protein n=1 Tax=Burkholderia sp. Tr-862 TaxID=2608331 RepID=UPI00141950C4|nr:hypothetical protein [Burkholderia sp. Tr-862]NIF43291.1 hypothetical protein [Burkholderia sp. Tr-862]
MDERAAIEPILEAHDAQLAPTPTHRYLEAWELLQRLGPARSPIRVADQLESPLHLACSDIGFKFEII